MRVFSSKGVVVTRRLTDSLFLIHSTLVNTILVSFSCIQIKVIFFSGFLLVGRQFCVSYLLYCEFGGGFFFVTQHLRRPPERGTHHSLSWLSSHHIHKTNIIQHRPQCRRACAIPCPALAMNLAVRKLWDRDNNYQPFTYIRKGTNENLFFGVASTERRGGCCHRRVETYASECRARENETLWSIYRRFFLLKINNII